MKEKSEEINEHEDELEPDEESKVRVWEEQASAYEEADNENAKPGSEEKEKRKHHKINIKNILESIAAIAVILLILYIIIKKPFSSKEGELTMDTTSMITKVVKDSTLNTIEYPLNSFKAVDINDDGNIDYYIVYDGTVKAGFDIKEINVSEPNENNEITITLPQIKFTDFKVENIRTIIMSKKVDSEAIAATERDMAYEDLKAKADGNKYIKEAATKNAESFEKQLVESVLEANSNDVKYTVTVVSSDGE